MKMVHMVHMLWYIYTQYSDKKSAAVIDSRVASYRPAFWKWKTIDQALKFGLKVPHLEETE